MLRSSYSGRPLLSADWCGHSRSECCLVVCRLSGGLVVSERSHISDQQSESARSVAQLCGVTVCCFECSVDVFRVPGSDDDCLDSAECEFGKCWGALRLSEIVGCIVRLSGHFAEYAGRVAGGVCDRWHGVHRQRLRVHAARFSASAVVE